jgi:transcription antitermination protein NusB
MGSRRTARERALQALYQLEIADGGEDDALAAAWAASAEGDKVDPDTQRFAKELVSGVQAHLPEIDGLIRDYSQHWRIDRMARIDRNVLRLGTFELKYRADIPRSVSIDEAVELGKRYGSEDSSSFVNGLLDRIAQALGKT